MNRELPEVVKIPGVGYGVRSASTPGAYRLVSGNECSCPAGENGAKSCRHRRAVNEWVRSHADDYARPRAVENPAVFVD